MDNHYHSQTRHAYQDDQEAKRYKEQHQGRLGWARLTMKRELDNVVAGLRHFGVGEADFVLDLPCGTGVAGPVFDDVPSRVLALDISMEMMGLARREYRPERLAGFVQSDITGVPLPDAFAKGAVVLGFLHRVPDDIKRATLAELHRVCGAFVLASFSIDSPLQRLKKRLLSLFRDDHRPAPAPISLEEIRRLAEEAGFRVVKVARVVPLLSSEVMVWMARVDD